MSNIKLRITVHDPNPPEVACERILEVFMDSIMRNTDGAIQRLVLGGDFSAILEGDNDPSICKNGHPINCGKP